MSANANTPMAGTGDPAGYSRLPGMDQGEMQWPAGAPPMSKHIEAMPAGEAAAQTAATE